MLRRRIGEPEMRAISTVLAHKLARFQPTVVVCVERAGRLVGETVAEELDVPLVGLDLSYPMSRLFNVLPRPARALLTPLKEVAYRLTSPAAHGSLGALPIGGRVALVDDSASTGRSLSVALDTFEAAGIGRERIRTAVIRCGKRARPLVDYYEIEEPVLFVRR